MSPGCGSAKGHSSAKADANPVPWKTGGEWPLALTASSSALTPCPQSASVQSRHVRCIMDLR